MTDSTENAAPPKSTRSQNLDSSEQIEIQTIITFEVVKIFHTQNPPILNTQSLRYLVVQIQIQRFSDFNLYRGIKV